MPKYVKISLHEMEEFVNHLTRGKYKKYKIGQELVFGYHLKYNQDLILLIYSSFNYDGYFSRKSGKDSIKITLFSIKENQNIGGRSRINRTENWRERLKDKFIDLGMKAEQLKCPCGGYYIVRKSKKTNSFFLGCIRYPNCTNKLYYSKK